MVYGLGVVYFLVGVLELVYKHGLWMGENLDGMPGMAEGVRSWDEELSPAAAPPQAHPRQTPVWCVYSHTEYKECSVFSDHRDLVRHRHDHGSKRPVCSA